MRKLGLTFLLFILAAACNDIDDMAGQPYFFDFETAAEMERFSWRCQTLFERTRDFATNGEYGLKLEFFPSKYPALKTSRFQPDWTIFSSLHFDVFNPEKDTLRLDFKIKDADDRQHYECLKIPPGQEHVALPLSALAYDNQNRKLDFSRIRSVTVYILQPKQKHTLYFDYFHLK